MSRPPAPALVLSALTLLFFARVLGQALVVFAGVTWLPPMDAWYSGLLPYPVLLPAQVVILAVQVVIDWRLWRGRVVVRPRSRAARTLRRFAYVYALAMLVRLAVTRSHPIPIVFHWVLAAYVWGLSDWGPRHGPQTPKRSEHPGGAVALLDVGCRSGGPRHGPQTSGAGG